MTNTTTKTNCEDDCNELPLGIVLSITLFAIYVQILDKLSQTFILKIDNWILSVIYFLPLIILYIRIPISLRKHNSWRRYID